MSYRNRNIGNGGGGGRKGAKEISKLSIFRTIDPDIVSNYENYEEDDRVTLPRPRRNERNRDTRGPRMPTKISIPDRINVLSGPRNAEQVNKVRIFEGRVFGEAWIMRQLNHQDIDDFKPIMVTTTPKGDIEFYLKSEEAAEAIKAINKRIVHEKTGKRVTFNVSKCPAPWTRLQKQDVDLISEVVDSRYNEQTRLIDLSNFYLDKKFLEKDAHLGLNKNNVMLAVLERIDEKYGNIVALSLKGNRLRFLNFASMLVHIAKFVTVLDLSDNSIDNMEQLSNLRGLPIKRLFFEGNPVCEQLTKSTDYLNAVHLVFPRVIILDGQDVPPSGRQDDIEEDGDSIKDIPPRAGYYFGSDEIRTLVEEFIISYIELYDGTNTDRKKLIPAYDETNSTFTITIENFSSDSRFANQDNFRTLKLASHNILQEDKWSKYRSSKTFRGAMEIAVQLAKLPATNHFKESFVVDVHLSTPSLLGFTLQGLYEEGPFATGGAVPILNFFSRSFYVAPRPQGSVAIISDMLFLSSISTERMARYKMFINKCIANGQATVQPIVTATPISGPSDNIKQQMIESFSSQSGMKPEWCAQCLQDSNWDYDTAGQTFLAKRPEIPAEAFINP